MIKRIAQYEIQADLGRGAFTRVLQGFDSALGRKVALKIPAQDDDRELFTGLLKEAAAAANFHHPNIVTIYEWGHDKGLPFIAVEYLQGQTLRRAIASHKPLTLLQKILIMSQIGDALHCAHQSGAVHLDIRPINVMLLDDASVKLMDFGAAELTPEKAEWLRDKGYLDESIPYAAPEQLTGSNAPPTLSDVFTYGVMYYELLTGRHPFHAARVSDVISRIINETPASVRDLAPECPEPLGRILAHTLAKDPHQRFESIAGIQAAVAPILLDLKKAPAAQPRQAEQPPAPRPPAAAQPAAPPEKAKPKDAAPPKPADAQQRTAKAQRERQQRLKAELGAVRQMIKTGRLDDAVRRLATLRIEFPEEKAVSDLLREAQPEAVKPSEPPAEEPPAKDAEKSPVPRWRWEIAAVALIIAGAGVGFRSKDLLGRRAAATAAPPAAIAAPVSQPVDPTPPLVTQPTHPVADPPPMVIEGPATIIAAPTPKPEPPPRAVWTAPASSPRSASQPAPVIAEAPSIAAAAPASSVSLPSTAAVGPVAAPPPPAPPPAAPTPKPLPYSPPKPLRQVPPTMPDNMKRAFTGEIVVSVRVDVDASGNVVNAVALKKGDRIADYLAGLAVNAARRWQFEPARRGPNPVPGEAVVNFTFQGTR